MRSARILIVCTANACRSPTVELITARALSAYGLPATVSSAGTRGGPTPVHRFTVEAASQIGIDLTRHRPRRVTPSIVESDGRDLVLTMTREHARELLAESPGASGRTFTLPELERLARALGIDPLTSSLEDWIAALDSLRSLELGSGSAADDVPDPYGGPRHGHRAMVSYVAELTESWVPNLAASTDPATFTNS